MVVIMVGIMLEKGEHQLLEQRRDLRRLRKHRTFDIFYTLNFKDLK